PDLLLPLGEHVAADLFDRRDALGDVRGPRRAPLVQRLELLVLRLELAALEAGQALERFEGRLDLLLRVGLRLARLLDALDEQVALLVAELLHRRVVEGAAGGEPREGEGERCEDLLHRRHGSEPLFSARPGPRATPRSPYAGPEASMTEPVSRSSTSTRPRSTPRSGART